MNFKEAMKAAIDGHKVRWIKWKDFGKLKYVMFDPAIGLMYYVDGVSYPEYLSDVLSQGINEEWEIIPTPPKFKPGDFFTYSLFDKPIGKILEYEGFIENEHCYLAIFGKDHAPICVREYLMEEI